MGDMRASEESRRVGANVRMYRIRMGMRQDELAARVGLSRTSVVNMEGGNQNVSLSRLVHYAQALDVNVADLMGQPETICIEVVINGRPMQNLLPSALMESIRAWASARPEWIGMEDV